MNLSSNSQATLLLTSYFIKASCENPKPLTIKEWGRFAFWLKDKSFSPADLLMSDPETILDGWHDKRISAERILQLLSRGHSLALAVEKWQRAGLWVVTRSDSEYPGRLKQRLKTDAPPVLFGCGGKDLLNSGGLAVVGSRNASDNDLSYTAQVGAKAASEGISIVSGGARGVDEAAMLEAMDNGGSVIGILANDLIKAATSTKWRKGLMDGNVVLVSPFYPEAGFSAGNAMARNKYIYCLADSSLVIHSGKKGGTLTGAEENLKMRWVPLWVKPTSDEAAANPDLVAKGGRWCEADIHNLNIAKLTSPPEDAISRVTEEQTDLFPPNVQPNLSGALEDSVEVLDDRADSVVSEEGTEPKESIVLAQDGDAASSEPANFYQIFIEELRRLEISPITLDEILASLDLHKSQLNEWLKRATNEGVVKKLNRPVRYEVVKTE